MNWNGYDIWRETPEWELEEDIFLQRQIEEERAEAEVAELIDTREE